MNENGELCGHCHEKIKQQLKKNKYKKIITLTCLAMSIGVLGIFSASTMIIQERHIREVNR